MKFDIHMHTLHSDGIASPADIVKAAKDAGLGGVAITDHDTMDGVEEAVAAGKKLGMIVIPAAEITTDIGDILAYGIKELPDGTPLQILNAIHEQGGVAAIAHPCGPWLPLRFVDMLKLFAGKIDALETYNASTPMAYNVEAMRVAKKAGLPGIAGSDAHLPEQVGAAFTEMDAKSVEDVLSAIKAGKVKIGWR